MDLFAHVMSRLLLFHLGCDVSIGQQRMFEENKFQISFVMACQLHSPFWSIKLKCCKKRSFHCVTKKEAEKKNITNSMGTEQHLYYTNKFLTIPSIRNWETFFFWMQMERDRHSILAKKLHTKTIVVVIVSVVVACRSYSYHLQSVFI